MKNISTKNKLIYAIACLIILVGAIVFFTKGFKFDMNYAKRNQIVLNNKTGFDIAKIKDISNKVLEGKEVYVREVEIFKNIVAISTTEMTEEEKTQIVDRVNQEYNLEISADDTKIQSIEQTRIKDIVKPYILPVIIAYALILLYFLFRYKKMGVRKILTEAIVLPIVLELEFFSIIAITRLPLGNITISLSIGIFAVTFIVLASRFNKEIEKIKDNEETKK